ncbi:hypothetical protein Aazo_4892 ['Nostoc azollae' 0708]|jgi:hypothetical protein|uniref:Uncharacterized protein n=1 Tax=Nostoc azollae (strain 0708) TaxID=551115 RepID=D7DYF2_NOSA0|nr:hypothetical protein Aazo_4892 ['Nostoc azollae' 0708]
MIYAELFFPIHDKLGQKHLLHYFMKNIPQLREIDNCSNMQIYLKITDNWRLKC